MEGGAIKNYGKKEQKEWLDNTLPDPHPCTAGNKEEEHISCSHKSNYLFLTISISVLFLYQCSIIITIKLFTMPV